MLAWETFERISLAIFGCKNDGCQFQNVPIRYFPKYTEVVGLRSEVSGVTEPSVVPISIFCSQILIISKNNNRILSRGDRVVALPKGVCNSWQESAEIYKAYHAEDSKYRRLYFDRGDAYIPGITEFYGCYEMTLSMVFFGHGVSSAMYECATERNWTDASLGKDAGCAIFASGAKKMIVPVTAAIAYLSYCWARTE